MFHMEHIPHPTGPHQPSNSMRRMHMSWVRDCDLSSMAGLLRHAVHFFATLMASQSDG